MASLQENLLPLVCENIPESFRLKAEKELNETKENVEKGLLKLRECIKREKLNLSSDEIFLMQFLRYAKFDFKKAEERLLRFPKFFAKYGELLITSDIKRIQAVLDSQFIIVPPVRDREGRAMLCVREDLWEKELFDANDAAVALLSLLMFCYTFSLTSICGITYLGDGTVESLLDVLPMIKPFKTFLPYLNCVPYRLQRADIINMNLPFRTFYRVVRPILPEKITKRVFVHDDKEVLQEVYPSSMLTKAFGGTMESINSDSYMDRFLEFIKNQKLIFESQANAD